MKEILINNETDFELPACVKRQIIADAVEYFGNTILMIRIQSGIERHTYNAKTCEVRFAFFPSDYGINQLTLSNLEEITEQYHTSKSIESYKSLLPYDFEESDDEGVLSVIDNDLEGITSEDEVDLGMIESEFNEIDTSDFEFYDEDL